jgi:8-oxo-dGTP pyrophosphatase MutT (NUDIX family)
VYINDGSHANSVKRSTFTRCGGNDQRSRFRWCKLSSADSQIEKLANTLSVFTDEQAADAAVALLLKKAGSDLEALFVKRVERSTDPWSGQIALPGGKREVKDKSLRDTVVRETLEETSIDLLAKCRLLGVMDVVRSAARREIRVLPFVFLLQHELTIRLNKAELEWSTWIPLDKLAKHKGYAKFSFGESPAYIVGKTIIWGLTYRLTENLLQMLRQVQNDSKNKGRR